MFIFIAMIILDCIGISVWSYSALHEPVVSRRRLEAHEILLVANLFLCRVLTRLRFGADILYMTLFDIILKDIIHLGIILKVVTFQSLKFIIVDIVIESSFRCCIYLKLEMSWFTIEMVFMYRLRSCPTRNFVISVLFRKWAY